MAGILFYFEPNDIDVWSGRDIDLDAWNYAAKVGKIDRVIIVNKTDYPLRPFDESIVTHIVPILDNMHLHAMGHITQIVGPALSSKAKPIWTFDHQTDWYFFGPASGWTDLFGNISITIPSPVAGGLHATHIATTVMFHRYKTLWL